MAHEGGVLNCVHLCVKCVCVCVCVCMCVCVCLCVRVTVRWARIKALSRKTLTAAFCALRTHCASENVCCRQVTYIRSPHIYTSTIETTPFCTPRVISEQLSHRALKWTIHISSSRWLYWTTGKASCRVCRVMKTHSIVPQLLSFPLALPRFPHEVRGVILGWADERGSCYDVEESGWLRSSFLFFFFFFPLQGLQTQHRMQGEASRRSGEVTSTMMLTPTRIPTTWRAS